MPKSTEQPHQTNDSGTDAPKTKEKPKAAPKSTGKTVAKTASKHVATKVAKSAAKKAVPKGSTSRPQNILKGTWLVGILVMWIYPLARDKWSQNYNSWIARQMLWTLVHIALLLMSVIGPRMAKFAASLGGLSLLALLLAPDENGLAFGRLISRTVGERAARAPRENNAPSPNISAWLDFLLRPPPQPQPDPNLPPLPLPPGNTVPDSEVPGIGIPV